MATLPLYDKQETGDFSSHLNAEVTTNCFNGIKAMNSSPSCTFNGSGGCGSDTSSEFSCLKI